MLSCIIVFRKLNVVTQPLVFLLLAILLSLMISQAEENARVNDTIKESFKQTSYNSFTEKYSEQLSKTGIGIVRLFKNSDSLTEQLSFNHNQLYSSAHILSANSPNSGMMLNIYNVMSSFRTGLSIWDSAGGRNTNQTKAVIQNNYKIRLSLCTTNHGAGLKLKF